MGQKQEALQAFWDPAQQPAFQGKWMPVLAWIDLFESKMDIIQYALRELTNAISSNLTICTNGFPSVAKLYGNR